MWTIISIFAVANVGAILLAGYRGYARKSAVKAYWREFDAKHNAA